MLLFEIRRRPEPSLQKVMSEFLQRWPWPATSGKSYFIIVSANSAFLSKDSVDGRVKNWLPM